MKIEAKVKFSAWPGLGDLALSEVVVPVDQDYVEADYQEVNDWVGHELERMFGRAFSTYDFDVVNAFDVVDDLSSFELFGEVLPRV